MGSLRPDRISQLFYSCEFQNDFFETAPQGCSAPSVPRVYLRHPPQQHLRNVTEKDAKLHQEMQNNNSRKMQNYHKCTRKNKEIQNNSRKMQNYDKEMSNDEEMRTKSPQNCKKDTQSNCRESQNYHKDPEMSGQKQFGAGQDLLLLSLKLRDTVEQLSK